MIDRRGVLRLGALGLTVLGTSRAVAQIAAATPPPRNDADGFTEVYKGRRIRATGTGRSVQVAEPPHVFIDGVELHLMPAGAGYTTAINHYQTFPTVRLAARTAVDGLRGANLLPAHR